MRLALWHNAPADTFEEDRYGPSERFRRQQEREQVLWRRHLRWIAKWPWPLRVIIVLFEITIAYTALVFGMALGLGLSALIF